MSREKSDILLESGTNEVEIFEFLVDGHRYGVNALKVRQVDVFDPKKIQEFPMMPAGVLGHILIRKEIIRVIDMRLILEMEKTARPARPIMLFCEFNRQVLGFIVDEIAGITRVNWSQVQSPSAILKTESITGVAVVGERKISMLDLESLIAPIAGIAVQEDVVSHVVIPPDFKILIADDSPVVRKKIVHHLQALKAHDIEVFENGALMLVRYMELNNSGEKVGLVLTDIEMPQLDGFACCKKIKNINSQQPVLIFSSLINEQIHRKCLEVGADAALNKEEFGKLDECISKFLSPAKAA